MVPPLIKSAAYRFVLPAALIAAAVIRPSFLSLGYVFLGLVSALLPPIRPEYAVPCQVWFYLIVTLCYTSLGLLTQTTYQVVEAVERKDDNAYLKSCDSWFPFLLRSCGYVRFHGGRGFESARSILPEILAWPASMLAVVVVIFLSHREQELDVVGDVQIVRAGEISLNARQSGGRDTTMRALGSAMKRLSNFAIILFAAVVGCVQPSVLNFFYFLVFLIVITWWASYKRLCHTAYNNIKSALKVYCVFHLCLLHAFQIPIVHQSWIPTNSLVARIFGLSVIMDSKCPDWWAFPFVPVDLEPDTHNTWPRYANPIVVLVFYYVLVLQYSLTRKGTRNYLEEDSGSSVHEERLASAGTNETQVRSETGDELISVDSASVGSGARERGHTLLLGNNDNHEAGAEDERREPGDIPLKKVTSQVMDRKKFSQIFNAAGEEESAAAKGMTAIVTFIIYHSYAIALAAMMGWALLYHSIFGLILLVATCIIWIFRDSRSVSFKCAPIIIVYVEFLLLLQYVLSMNLPEIAAKQTDWMKWMGIALAQDAVHAFVILFVKVLLSLPIFFLLRLSRREKYYESLSDYERARRVNSSYGTFSSTGPRHRSSTLASKGSGLASVLQYLSSRVAIYFIFVVSLTLLLVATNFKPTFYTIGFFGIWALSIFYLKVSFRLFRGVAYAFWFSLIFYTSLVIIVLYVYQFPGVSSWLKQQTGLSTEWLEAIGLVDYSAIGESGALFLRLFAPICLFVVTMLQLKFFHEPWSAAVQPVRGDMALSGIEAQADELPGTSANRHETLAAKTKRVWNDGCEFLWRFFEVHISKIVFIIIATFVATNVYALYIPLILLLSLAVCLPAAADGIFSILMCCYLFLVAIAKMIYQMKVIPPMTDINRSLGADNCTYNKTLSDWLGLFKEEKMPINLLWGLIVSVIALAFQSIVVYRQRHHRALRGLPEDTRNRIFPEFHIDSYDRSIVNGFKFVLDYGFFKFGFEICLILMGVDAWVRMDAMGAIQVGWIALFALNKRAFARGVWPIYVMYMGILLPVQYVLYVGLPPDGCIAYPWSHLLPSSFPPEANRNLAVLLGLSTYGIDWPAGYLMIDFFVLLFASCQLTVFRREGTDNDTIYVDGEYTLRPENPRYDFIDNKKSFVDYVKVIVFHYGHWITLISTLGAGIAGTSLFALGYIVLTLVLLWKGNNLYVMDTNTFRATLDRWNLILSYTIFTIFMKVVLQIFGCVFLSLFEQDVAPWGRVLCIVRQLLSVTCVNRLSVPLPELAGHSDFEKACGVDTKEAQIGYDVIALGFLVFQLRTFHSWYFQHCMVEYRSEVILANRGAVLKNQLIEKEMKEQNEQQNGKFNDIRKRTEAIRDRYRKQQSRGERQATIDPKTYGQDELTDELEINPDDPLPFYDPRIPAKRAGDYYMFNYDPEKDDLVEPVQSFVPEVDPEAVTYDRLDPGQLVYAATSKDLDLAKTMIAVKKGEKIKGVEEKMIAVVNEASPPPPRSSGGGDAVEADTQPSEDSVDQVDESQVVTLVRFVQKMIVSGMDLVSVHLNRLCREHRYVGFVLKKEKEKLKCSYAESLSNTSRKLTDLRTDVDLSTLQVVQSENDVEKMETAANDDWQSKSVFARFANALGNCMAAHTDLVCYVLAVMVQVTGGGLITLPLPLMVFLWGTLSNPRPSKFFWVTMIAYTEAVIIVKFVCQFSFFHFNSTEYINENGINPVALDKVFGVSKRDSFALWDTLLLFALFFHRYMLRKFGLWKDANLTETFAVVGAAPIEGEGTMGLDAQQINTDENAPAVPNVDSPANSSVGPIGRFIHQLFHPKFRYIRDLYPEMFSLDAICFIIIVFGYSDFGEGGSGNVLGDIKSSRIPITLVVMLIVVSVAMIVDRALYLRKWVVGKLIYQLITISFINVWIFFVLPNITRRAAIANTTAQFLYVVKALYLLVSAWQIRNSYPQLCIGNLLTHSYGIVNLAFFKIFMFIPFLFELRTLIDWTWTDTSMPLFDFFNMENMYGMIFNIKCQRTFENNYPAPRGQPKGVVVKYLMGLPFIFGIIIIVWSPLLAFSLLNQIGQISMPERVRLTVSIEGYPPLYQIEAQGKNNNELRPMTQTELRNLNMHLTGRYDAKDTNSIQRSRLAIAYLKDYTDEDILVVKFRPESQTYWPISSEAVAAMVEKLETINSSIFYVVAIEFTRPYDADKKTAIKHETKWSVPIPADPTVRQQIADAIRMQNSTTNTIEILRALPSYMQVPNEGEVLVPKPIADSIMLDGKTKINSTGLTGRDADQRWFDALTLNLTVDTAATKLWVASAAHPIDDDVFLPSTKTSYSSLPYVQVVAFVDRAFPSLFASMFKGGVLAMYATVIFVLGRGVVRGLFTISPGDIMFNEIPNPNHLLKICHDIYLVREAKDFVLEQDLFAKLIFLYRSPATLIEWTRYKVKNE